MSWQDVYVSRGDMALPRSRCPGLSGLRGLLSPAPDPQPQAGARTLTGQDFEVEWVLLLDGVGEVEAGIAAVVCLHVLQHHIREIQVSIMALGDTFVLGDGLHGYKEAGVQGEVSSNDNSNKNHHSSGDSTPTNGQVGARSSTVFDLILSTLRQKLFPF